VDVERVLPYNDKIKLNPKQLALIEAALHRYPESKKEVRELLAHLYHQKIWYRPKKGIYVSG
jgi:NADH:ubiquinone oxidoreductase subunit E